VVGIKKPEIMNLVLKIAQYGGYVRNLGDKLHIFVPVEYGKRELVTVYRITVAKWLVCFRGQNKVFTRLTHALQYVIRDIINHKRGE